MVPVSAFLPRLIPNVIGCPEPLAVQALLDSAVDFCDRSLAVQTTLDAANLVAGESLYELDLPSQTLLAQVLKVWVDGRLLQAIPSAQADEPSRAGPPRFYFAQDVDETVMLRLSPVPDQDAAGALVVRVATRPTRSATQVHSALFNDWSEVVLNGALARLYDIPNQSFTDAAKALLLTQKVRHATNMARSEALHGRAVSSMRVTMRRF